MLEAFDEYMKNQDPLRDYAVSFYTIQNDRHFSAFIERALNWAYSKGYDEALDSVGELQEEIVRR